MSFGGKLNEFICMESSSNDSFLWTDASNNSDDNIINKTAQFMDNDYESKSGFGPHGKQRAPEINIKINNEHDSKQKRKKTKKRKFSELTLERSLPSPSDKSIQDASNDSDDRIKDVTVESIGDGCERRPDGIVSNEQNVPGTNHESEHKTKKKEKKSKKKKHSEILEESSDYSQPERKRIKLEPESDIEIGKKRTVKKEKNVHNRNMQDSILQDEEYLNFRVKQEQSPYIQMEQMDKKKTPKRSNSNIDNVCRSDSIERNTESYLDMRVKEEQASLLEHPNVKSKKKKKRKRSTGCSDLDITSETKSTLADVSDSEATLQDNASVNTEHNKYYAIEEKFSAEDFVIEKPRKKKHKIDSVTKNDSKGNNDLVCTKQKSEITFKVSEKINNDMSLGPNDFTCNNIVSSTIINSSAMDLEEPSVNNKKELSRNKNICLTKISDRIQFEDDDNSSLQDSEIGKTSSKANMLLKVNPQWKVCAPEIPKECLITKDDEIWVVTLPHDLDLDMLKGTTLFSEGKCKIKINGETYEGVPNDDVNRITLVTHEHGLAVINNLPVTECMNYRKRIPTVHIPNHNIMVNNQTNFIPLPETKCRHPLFGPHYKKAIKISGSVAERLQAAEARRGEAPSGTVNKRKRKKDKHKAMEEGFVEVKVEGETLKKKKKRKHSQEESSPPRKVKRVKIDADCPAVWESEQAIEENLFNF